MDPNNQTPTGEEPQRGEHNPMSLAAVSALLDDIGMYFKDRDGCYTFANEALCQLLGSSKDEVLGQTDERFFDVASCRSLRANELRVLHEGAEIAGGEEVVLRGGDARVFWSIKVPVRDAEQRVVGLCGIYGDATSSQHASEDMHERALLLDTLLSNIEAYVYVKDHEGRYLYVNQQVIDLYGRPPSEIIGRDDHEIHAPAVASRLVQTDQQVLSGRTRRVQEEALVDAHGRERHFWSVKLALEAPGHPPRVIGFSSEITELVQLRNRLKQRIRVDPLTRLLNGIEFEERLDAALASAEGRPLAVLALDLDRFKYINGGLGKEVGDRLLGEIAERLRACAEAHGLSGVARLTSDKFAGMLTHAPTGEHVAECAEQIRRDLARPYELSGRRLHVTASIGASLYPEHGGKASELIGNAEAAIYDAKELGRDQYRAYSHELGDQVARRLKLENDLRTAVVEDQFELYYQPKYSRDGTLVGIEALIRWHRPGHGLMLPAEFIPLAEQIGLMTRIGDRALEEACRQAASWAQASGAWIPVAVNCSASQLLSPTLPDRVGKLLTQCSVPRLGLEIEITESVMMANPDRVVATLMRLHEMGVRLAVDDFGTGFASVDYMKRLPVHALKLDGSFIERIEEHELDARLSEGIIALAHGVELEVVAERVERPAQRDLLMGMGCDVFQGYLFGKPLPAAEMADLLQ